MENEVKMTLLDFAALDEVEWLGDAYKGCTAEEIGGAMIDRERHAHQPMPYQIRLRVLFAGRRLRRLEKNGLVTRTLKDGFTIWHITPKGREWRYEWWVIGGDSWGLQKPEGWGNDPFEKRDWQNE